MKIGTRTRRIFISFLLIALTITVQAQYRNYFLQAGRTAIINSKYLEAISLLNMELKLDSNSHLAYFLRGIAKYYLEDFVGAEQDYTKTLELAPYFSDAYFNRAAVRSRQRKYETSLSDYSMAIKTDSTNPRIYFGRAQTYLNLKKYNEAINDCNKTIQLKLSLESVYILRGTAKSGLELFKEALTDINKAINYNPENVVSLIQRGNIFSELQKYDSALYDLNRALSLDSMNSYGIFSKAITYMKMKEYDHALKNLNKVIQLTPYNSYAYFNRAIIYQNNKNLGKALLDFNAVIQLNPEHIMSHFYRGLIHSELKQFKEAEKDLSKTIELFPLYIKAYRERSRVRRELKDEEGAYDDYAKVEELNAGNGVDEIPKTKEMAEYLHSIVSLSGSFEDSQSLKLVQNQIRQAEILPVYQVVLNPHQHSNNRFYDAYNQKGFIAPIVCFTNSLFTTPLDSASRQITKINQELNTSSDNKADLFYKRALIYASIEDYNQAFIDFELCLQEDPKFVLAYYSRARVRHSLIDFLESINSMKNQISIGKPKQEKQKITIIEHSFDKVLQDYNKAIELDPQFAFAYYNRAYIKTINGNFHRAIDDFSEVIKLMPDFSEAYYNRGLLLLYLKEQGLGCNDLSRAGELGLSVSYSLLKRYCSK